MYLKLIGVTIVNKTAKLFIFLKEQNFNIPIPFYFFLRLNYVQKFLMSDAKKNNLTVMRTSFFFNIPFVI